MKTIIIVTIVTMLAYTGFKISGGNFGEANVIPSSEKEIISFYEVPLVCGAAPEIGCGSRAKPVLLEMEKNSAVFIKN